MPDEVRKVVSTHKNGDRNEVGMYWTDKPIISDSSITGRKMCTNNIASSMYAKFFFRAHRWQVWTVFGVFIVDQDCSKVKAL